MTFSPRISVAMATYNGERYIREQLDSIASQSLLPHELVVTDDGSTDATLAIVEDFARTAPFSVRICRNEVRLGFADNFMKATSLCQGELIALSDQDDVWLENKLSLCCSFFVDPEVSLVAHSAWALLPSGERGVRFPDYSRTRMTGRTRIRWYVSPPGFAMMIRRVVAQMLPGTARPEWFHSHDRWLWFLAGSVGKVATLRDALVLYRQHTTNLYGAGPPLTVAGRVRRSAGIQSFDKLAETESTCSQLLLQAAGQNGELSKILEESARDLAFRSKLHRARTCIYGREAGLRMRTHAFCRILLLGGYWPGNPWKRLGMVHGIKDLFFGVSGGYKLIDARSL
ncbi:MAG: glycosyltransferase family 2 protein [Acidobacteriaceae bacterium]